MTARIVPLFTLNTVLFPGMVLPLHIFEPRYRVMIQRCIDAQQLFGVVLIRAGEEVGAPAEPFETGTLAAIQHVEMLEDGRMNLLTVGTSRFRLVEQIAGEPYAQGRIEVIEDPAEGDEDETLASVRERFGSYLAALHEVSNLPYERPDLGWDPCQLSYHIAAMLPIELAEKQRLLELSSVSDRLAAELALIERETEALRHFAEKVRENGYFYVRGKRLSMN